MINLSNLKIATKLYLLVSIAMAGLVAALFVAQSQMSLVYEEANYANVNTMPSYNRINQAKDAFRKIQYFSRDHLLATDELKLIELDRAIHEERETIRRAFDDYEKDLIANEEDQRLLIEAKKAISNWFVVVEQRLTLSRQNRKAEAFALDDAIAPFIEAVEQAFENHIAYIDRQADTSSRKAFLRKQDATQTFLAAAAVMLLGLALFGWFIANRELAKPIEQISDALNELASGNKTVVIAGTSRKDEVGNIARAAQIFRDFAVRIESQRWVKEQHSHVASVLQNASTIEQLAQSAISLICPLVNAQHGLFYIKSDHRLDAHGRFGHTEQQNWSQSITVGEGLVGQCALDRKPISISKPPEGYIRVGSGLGESAADEIKMLPVIGAGELQGVVEVAAFKPFGSRELALLDELLPTLATQIELLKRSIDTERLLKETQEQAERMEAQAAKLEEQSVEMEAQQVELAATEAWYRSIIANAPEGAAVVDSNGAIVLSNQKLEELFGYLPGKMIGLSIDALVPTTIRKNHDKLRDSFVKTGGSRRMGQSRALFGVRADGSEFPIEVGLSQLPDALGRGVCTYASVRDVSERRAAEAALKEAKEAAELATKAKGDFLASMSHEIRTPMNGITGMADLLSQTPLDDDQKHMLKTIRESGNALITVINDILDFSKIEAGKMDFENISMSIADVLEGVASTLTPNATKKHIRINTFVDPSIPEAVQGDAVRVRQVLFNLTGNAVKFSENKDVAMRASVSRVEANGRVWIRFDVIDQGIGISEENQSKLFQAFSQAESSTTRKFGGTGLGLAICKRLVEMMGGKVGLKSKVGEGSTFFAEIAFTPTDTTRTNEKPRDLHGLRIILVGSSGMREEAILAYLTHWGAEAVSVASAAKAAEMAKVAQNEGRSYSSVILDLDLDNARHEGAITIFRNAIVGRKMPMILLQDYQARGARIKSEDIVTIDANPLIRYRLITAVAVAAGRASPQVRTDSDVAVEAPAKAPSVEQAAAMGQLILLAEDNLTNQDVIRRQLSMLGYACEIANNGIEALKAWRSGRHALLLTDCHMPEMDGYELTGSIRKEEGAGANRLPIIAVTANALQGEAERCIAAGMDDYVSKPIAMPVLRATLKKWMPKPRNVDISDASNSSQVSTVSPSSPAIDDRAIKDMFGDDEALFKEILDSFVAPSKDIINEICIACDGENASGVKEAAHKLKSSARSVGANALADTCAALEAAGKSSDWSQIRSLKPIAESQFSDVLDYVRKL